VERGEGKREMQEKGGGCVAVCVYVGWGINLSKVLKSPLPLLQFA